MEGVPGFVYDDVVIDRGRESLYKLAVTTGRRFLRLALAAMLLGGQPAGARELPSLPFLPVSFSLTDEDPCREGRMATEGTGLLAQKHSPAPSVIPFHDNLNPAPSVWGAGWHEASDATLQVRADGSVTWVDGSGAQRTFTAELGTDIDLSDPALLEFAIHGTTSTPAPAGLKYRGTPTYLQPLNTYERLVFSTGAAANLPTELRLESVNGDVTRFNAFESSAVLRPALLTDRNGNTLAYARDAGGRLIKVTDVHGRFTAVAYSTQGFVQTLTDHSGLAGRVVTYGYDALGRKTSEVGPEGTTGYLYEGTTARIARITYPNGSFRRYEYDAAGRVTLEASDNEEDKLTYVYESTRTLITDAFLKTTVRELKSLSGALRPFRITDPKGGVTELAYDENLNLTRFEDPRDHATTYAYDAFGNVTDATTLADNGSTLTQYGGPFHQPSLVTDPNTNQTAFGYNSPQGDLTSVTTPDGTTTMGHDPFGHVTNSDPPGPVPATTFGYDPATGALDLVTDPLGRPTQLLRDTLSRVRTNIDPKGKRTDFSYDDDGSLKTVKEYLPGQTLETRYEYVPGRTGRLLSKVFDAKNQETRFEYDGLGRLQYVSNPVDRLNAKRKEFTYDQKSRLKTSRDPDANLLTFDYDDLDRLTLKQRPDGNVNYGYDANGNLTTVNNPNAALAMTYDVRDRLETVRQTVGGVEYLLTYGYDKNGNRKSMATPWGTFLYTYDSMNRLDLMTVPASLGAPARTFDFDYDALGRRTKLVYPNNTEAVYTYDEASQLKEIRHKLQASTHTLALAQYDYDAAGNRTSMTDLNGTHFYGYDDLHRATAAVHPAGSALEIKHEVFTYDAVGNRLADARAGGYDYDSANRLLSDSLYTYCNDDNGNRTCRQSRTAPLDRTNYAYDSENQLIQVANATGTFNYKYDGLGRRIEKSSGAAAGQTVRYVYDNEDILATVDGANNLIAVFGHGPGIDEPLMMRKGDGLENFMHANALDNSAALSNAAGAVAESVEYETFGSPRFIDRRGGGPVISRYSSIGSMFAFTGREWDEGVDLFFFRARVLDSSTGRFLQKDLQGHVLGVNLYLYARGNPQRFIDPEGADIREWIPGAFAIDAANQVGSTVLIFGIQYGRLKTPNNPRNLPRTINRDKYFHCMANCQSAKLGRVGEITASIISGGREVFDASFLKPVTQWISGSRVRGSDSPFSCALDHAANVYGRKTPPNASCEDRCTFITQALPADY